MTRFLIAAAILAAFGAVNIYLEPRRRKESARDEIRRRNTTPGGWESETGGFI